MQKIILDIPENHLDVLSDAFYEVESYKTIMEQLLTNKDTDFSYNLISDFRKDYKKALMIYDKAKVDFEFDFVKEQYPTAIEWLATFGDGKVEITYQDK